MSRRISLWVLFCAACAVPFGVFGSAARAGSPTGACCIRFRGCFDNYTRDQCDSVTGVSSTYLGDGTTCASPENSTCPIGACCMDDGTCEDSAGNFHHTVTSCFDATGRPMNYLGDGTTCANTTCRGACCIRFRGCFDDYSFEQCDSVTGVSSTYLGHDTTCGSPDNTTCPIGACCNDGMCEDSKGDFHHTVSSCFDATGSTQSYLGDGTTCATVSTTCRGACCDVSDDGCVGNVSLEECRFEMSGTFLGHDTDCAAGDTCPTGACCIGSECYETRPDDNTIDMTHGFCVRNGDFYLGDNSVCTADACIGACCVPSSGMCIETDIRSCRGAATGGLFQGLGTECDSITCPFGACCLGENGRGGCAEETDSGDAYTQSQCGTDGGTYLGDASTCTGNPECPTGACCIGSQCFEEHPNEDTIFMTRAFCEASGDFYLGDGSMCEPGACFGACCFPEDPCLEMDIRSCEGPARNGLFHGLGTECDAVDCTIGACTTCCECTHLNEEDCDAIGGEFHGSVVRCDSIDFAPDTTPPVITHCPEPITLERGDKLCDTAVQDWLDSFTATDNCLGGRIYEASGLGLPILDNAPGGIAHNINVPDSFIIEDLNVDLTITHPFVGDLIVVLSKSGLPMGRTLIFQPLGCSADNYAGIILDDEAAMSIQDQCTDNLTSPPNYSPFVGGLSNFDGIDAQGNWTILVADVRNGQVGTLDGWSLHFNSGPTLSNDAPECGFPAGETTEVTFTATDACGNTDTCTSSITIEPAPRVTFDQKGSLLIFSKVEIKWDAEGNLIQDTFLDVTNDYPGAVNVQAYFINGDINVPELLDENGGILQIFEPGWNTADCRFQLTGNQPHYWSAANGSDKCQPFTVLDSDGPGRLDPETADASRILRGYVVMWAVTYLESPGLWAEIRWNHLTGDAVIINYANGTAWEYNAWSFAAVDCVLHGEPTSDCIERDENGVCCARGAIPGSLGLDGYAHAAAFDTLLLDFYGSGSMVLSSGDVTASVDTDLTVHAVDADLRQDGCGPVLTKIEAEIWNEFETKFSGTRRCICCWDQTMLSNWVRSATIPNHFKRSALRTDKGKARLDGVYSTECDYEELCGRTAFDKMWSCGMDTVVPYGSLSKDAAILGLATKFIAFSGNLNAHATAGMNLVGAGRELATIIVDGEDGTEELHDAAGYRKGIERDDRQVPAKGASRNRGTMGNR